LARGLVAHPGRDDWVAMHAQCMGVLRHLAHVWADSPILKMLANTGGMLQGLGGSPAAVSPCRDIPHGFVVASEVSMRGLTPESTLLSEAWLEHQGKVPLPVFDELEGKFSDTMLVVQARHPAETCSMCYAMFLADAGGVADFRCATVFPKMPGGRGGVMSTSGPWLVRYLHCRSVRCEMPTPQGRQGWVSSGPLSHAMLKSHASGCATVLLSCEGGTGTGTGSGAAAPITVVMNLSEAVGVAVREAFARDPSGAATAAVPCVDLTNLTGDAHAGVMAEVAWRRLGVLMARVTAGRVFAVRALLWCAARIALTIGDISADAGTGPSVVDHGAFGLVLHAVRAHLGCGAGGGPVHDAVTESVRRALAPSQACAVLAI
jgi:hypothetical protein